MSQGNIEYLKKIKNGMIQHDLASWEEFLDFVKDPKRCVPTLIYRGQANTEWKVESTLDRLEKRYPTRPNLGDGVPNEFDCPRVNRDTHLRRFKETARGKLISNIPSEDNDSELWALAQHHGLATPMLDWTYSPAVALFFAFEDELCECNGKREEPKNRAIFALAHHLLSECKEQTAGEELAKVFVPEWHANYRVSNQGGLFVRMPQGMDLEAYMDKHFQKENYVKPPATGVKLYPRAVLEKFIMQNKNRIECLRYLDYMNINRASLFPDLEGAGRYVNDLWEVNFDKAIGYTGSE